MVHWLLPGEQCQDQAGRTCAAVVAPVPGDITLNKMTCWKTPFALPEQGLISCLLLCSIEQHLERQNITSAVSFWGCSHRHEIPFIKWVNIRSYHLGPEETLTLKRFIPENIWFGLQYTVLSDNNKCREKLPRKEQQGAKTMQQHCFHLAHLSVC